MPPPRPPPARPARRRPTNTPRPTAHRRTAGRARITINAPHLPSPGTLQPRTRPVPAPVRRHCRGYPATPDASAMDRPEFRAYFSPWGRTRHAQAPQKVGTFMPVRYGRDTRAKAIRLVRGRRAITRLEYAAITPVAAEWLQMSPGTLRKWSRASWKAGPSAYGMMVERQMLPEKMCGMLGVPVGGHRGRRRGHRSRVPPSVAGWRNREIVACHGRRTREHRPPALARRQVCYRGKAVAIQAR